MHEKNRLLKKYANGSANYFIYMEKKEKNCVAKFPMCLFVSVKIPKKNQTIFKDGMTFLFSEL